LIEDSTRFRGREDYRQLCRPSDALDVVDEIEFSIEHLLGKKQQRAESLGLSGCGDALFDRKMSEKFGDFFLAHFVRVAFAMKENVTANPIDIRLLSADRVMFDAQMPANAIE
jgi:hypothetical protein